MSESTRLAGGKSPSFLQVHQEVEVSDTLLIQLLADRIKKGWINPKTNKVLKLNDIKMRAVRKAVKQELASKEKAGSFVAGEDLKRQPQRALKAVKRLMGM